MRTDAGKKWLGHLHLHTPQRLACHWGEHELTLHPSPCYRLHLGPHHQTGCLLPALQLANTKFQIETRDWREHQPVQQHLLQPQRQPRLELPNHVLLFQPAVRWPPKRGDLPSQAEWMQEVDMSDQLEPQLEASLLLDEPLSHANHHLVVTNLLHTHPCLVLPQCTHPGAHALVPNVHAREGLLEHRIEQRLAYWLMPCRLALTCANCDCASSLRSAREEGERSSDGGMELLTLRDWQQHQ